MNEQQTMLADMAGSSIQRFILAVISASSLFLLSSTWNILTF